MEKGSSLQPKGDGILSVTLFAFIVPDEYSSKTCNIKYILNNQALIQQYEEHLEFEIPYPNMTLQVEYDIIKQIYQINKLHEITASFHLVQGHLDRNKYINKLQIEAQQNTSADTLANK